LPRKPEHAAAFAARDGKLVRVFSLLPLLEDLQERLWCWRKVD
jgi:hypothetical protein